MVFRRRDGRRACVLSRFVRRYLSRPAEALESDMPVVGNASRLVVGDGGEGFDVVRGQQFLDARRIYRRRLCSRRKRSPVNWVLATSTRTMFAAVDACVFAPFQYCSSFDRVRSRRIALADVRRRRCVAGRNFTFSGSLHCPSRPELP